MRKNTGTRTATKKKLVNGEAVAEVFRCLAQREYGGLAWACTHVTKEQRYGIAVRLGIISELDQESYVSLTRDEQVAGIVQWAEDHDPSVKVLRLHAEFVEFRIMVGGMITDLKKFDIILHEKQDLEGRVAQLTEANATLLRVVDRLVKN